MGAAREVAAYFRFSNVIDLVLAFGCVVGARCVAVMLFALGIVILLLVVLLIMGLLIGLVGL